MNISYVANSCTRPYRTFERLSKRRSRLSHERHISLGLFCGVPSYQSRYFNITKLWVRHQRRFWRLSSHEWQQKFLDTVTFGTLTSTRSTIGPSRSLSSRLHRGAHLFFSVVDQLYKVDHWPIALWGLPEGSMINILGIVYAGICKAQAPVRR